MFADVRVPLAGVAASGSGADLGPTDTELPASCLCITADLLFDDLAETLNVPIEMPAIHKRTPSKVRAVTKADLEF